jgi:ATP phosphoribosyltransferase regulatory subunit HisZ
MNKKRLMELAGVSTVVNEATSKLGLQREAREAYREMETLIDILAEVDPEKIPEIADQLRVALQRYGSSMYHATGVHPRKMG